MFVGILQERANCIRIEDAVTKLIVNILDIDNLCPQVTVLRPEIGEGLHVRQERRIGDDDVIRAIVHAAQLGWGCFNDLRFTELLSRQRDVLRVGILRIPRDERISEDDTVGACRLINKRI